MHGSNAAEDVQVRCAGAQKVHGLQLHVPFGRQGQHCGIIMLPNTPCIFLPGPVRPLLCFRMQGAGRFGAG